ncbi:E3 ubiquitin-protein ligase herc2 [Desmophyllum pertusum]|uniref:E3 ubiquitin-protein ligase herc2 n=1 Tax=Desmophyllum pertusum TaxID=174260 RepID=A0A9W9YUZ4_9CNID|nr:E3 ubiquitin-protein ligase herc2 [Desmophyllum pertusum]
MALSMDGDVYSWGEGDDGKLGHGSRNFCDRPRVIRSPAWQIYRGHRVWRLPQRLYHKRRRAVHLGKGKIRTAGSWRQRGPITAKTGGSVTWTTRHRRSLWERCDAQTLCLTDNDCVWSWGDGDYGKLGRGGSDGCKVPMKVESLMRAGVCKVECGSQFSVALTKSGAVYTW